MVIQFLQKLPRWIPLWQRILPRYPLYYKGDPQLRVFLPLFWMKMVKPAAKTPPSTVVFECHHQMTKYDVKNYLEKIYDVPVASVRIDIFEGKDKKSPVTGSVVDRERDRRIAYIHLAEEETFEFPELFKNKKTEEEKGVDQYKKMANTFNKDYQKHWTKQDVPSWFR